MRHILNHRPSPAMIVACIALIVALGGTSYAALKLPRNSVGNKQLKPSAVTSGKVRNGTLSAKDFKPSALKRGPRGPQGPGAPGAIPRVAYASRDMFRGPGGTGASLALTGAGADVVGLDVPVGTSDYTSSSGRVSASGPSRLIANGQAVILNAEASAQGVACRIVLVGTEPRSIGNYVNALIDPGGGYSTVAVSSGADVDAGSYDVRLHCQASAAGVSFHRGNLTVSVAPR
jgi:hypothetical protein